MTNLPPTYRERMRSHGNDRRWSTLGAWVCLALCVAVVAWQLPRIPQVVEAFEPPPLAPAPQPAMPEVRVREVPGMVSTVGSLDVGSVKRQWVQMVPETDDPEERFPMVILIHGSLHSADEFGEVTGFSGIAQRERFILVLPELERPGTGWTAHPEIFDGPKPSDDLGFFRRLLPRLERTLPVDPTRIYIAGHLSGGIMAYRLAGEMPERFAAVGAVSGSVRVRAVRNQVLSEVPAPALPVPAVQFHGYKDEKVPYLGGASASAGRRYASADFSLRFWASTFGEGLSRHSLEVGPGVFATMYASPNGRPEALLYTYSEGDHDWPLGEPADGAERMWAFFRLHRRD